MIAATPISFIAVVLVSLALAFLIVRRIYEERLKVALELVDIQKQRLLAYKERFGSTEVDDFLEKYPMKKLGKSWELIQGEGDDRVFLHDLKTRLKHHIANPETMDGLGLDWGIIKKHVSPKQIESINTGIQIKARS